MPSRVNPPTSLVTENTILLCSAVSAPQKLNKAPRNPIYDYCAMSLMTTAYCIISRCNHRQQQCISATVVRDWLCPLQRTRSACLSPMCAEHSERHQRWRIVFRAATLSVCRTGDSPMARGLDCKVDGAELTIQASELLPQYA